MVIFLSYTLPIFLFIFPCWLLRIPCIFKVTNLYYMCCKNCFWLAFGFVFAHLIDEIRLHLVVFKKTQGLNLNIQHCRQILYCWATREDSFLSYHNANITLFLPISTVSSFLLFLLSCQRSISSIFKNETSFFKSSFLKTVFSFKINAFILFF